MHIFTVKKFHAESFLVYSEGLHCLRILFALQKGALKEALARCLHQVAYISNLLQKHWFTSPENLLVAKTMSNFDQKGKHNGDVYLKII